jgi:hypothetical protein
MIKADAPEPRVSSSSAAGDPGDSLTAWHAGGGASGSGSGSGSGGAPADGRGGAAAGGARLDAVGGLLGSDNDDQRRHHHHHRHGHPGLDGEEDDLEGMDVAGCDDDDEDDDEAPACSEEGGDGALGGAASGGGSFGRPGSPGVMSGAVFGIPQFGLGGGGAGAGGGAGGGAAARGDSARPQLSGTSSLAPPSPVRGPGGDDGGSSSGSMQHVGAAPPGNAHHNPAAAAVHQQHQQRQQQAAAATAAAAAQGGAPPVFRSEYRGVSYDKKKRKWRVQIKVAALGKSGVSVGYFDTETAAARAYDRAAIGLLGRQSCRTILNYPMEGERSLPLPHPACCTPTHPLFWLELRGAGAGHREGRAGHRVEWGVRAARASPLRATMCCEGAVPVTSHALVHTCMHAHAGPLLPPPCVTLPSLRNLARLRERQRAGARR